MANLDPLAREDLEEFESFFAELESLAGYVPTAYFTLAHQPAFLEAWIGVSRALRTMRTVDPRLKALMSHVSSNMAGCRFCQAHTGQTAVKGGVSTEKLEAVWTFETSEMFTDAERAALRLAMGMGQTPNAVTPEHFDELRQHFDTGQISEMIIAVSMFGFWNRWNDTIATELERPVVEFATAHLADHGWDGSKHVHASE